MDTCRKTGLSEERRCADLTYELSGLGMDITIDSPSEFAAYIRDELAKWPPVVKSAGASFE